MKTKSVPINQITLQKRGSGATAEIVVIVRFLNGVEKDAIVENIGGFEGEIYHTIHIGGLDILAEDAEQK